MIVIAEYPEPVTGSRATTGGKQRDIATTHWGGKLWRVVSANGASMALARQLVEAGCPDQDFVTTTIDGQEALRGKSLHRWAQLMIVEGNRGLRRVPFRQFPVSGADQDGE